MTCLDFWHIAGPATYPFYSLNLDFGQVVGFGFSGFPLLDPDAKIGGTPGAQMCVFQIAAVSLLR